MRVFQGRHRLSRGLGDVADTGKEVGLSALVKVKGGEPLVPLLFGCFRLFEVANDREFETREETVIDNLVVLPLVGVPVT